MTLMTNDLRDTYCVPIPLGFIKNNGRIHLVFIEINFVFPSILSLFNINSLFVS